MSKDIIVLTPNGRRQTVKCTLNTTVLQILEDVCKKQGYEAANYDLRHHNKVLDLSNTIRFSNLPNKAVLEIVEAERTRQDSVLTIALQLENGDRRLGDFSPQASLFAVLESLAAAELAVCAHPTVVYTRHEVFGEALKSFTLRHLGLTGGRAVLRLIDKSPEDLKCQANVSSALPSRQLKPDEPAPSTSRYMSDLSPGSVAPGTSQPPRSDPPASQADRRQTPYSHGINPIKLIKDEIKKSANVNAIDETEEIERADKIEDVMMIEENAPSTSSGKMESGKGTLMEIDEDQLQRRLNIEKEVTFLGERKAVAFTQPEAGQAELADLPDDFYELSVDEVRRLYRDLRQQSSAAADAPLLTAQQRASITPALDKQSSHKYVVVRIQFPDRMILQGVFSPADTIGDVQRFVGQYLRESSKPFLLSTTLWREPLDPTMSLLDAKFVPCVLMHFRWEGGAVDAHCLAERVYSKQTSSDAAAMLASKYRAPTRRKMEEAMAGTSRPAATTASSKDSKTPKWFKMKP